MKILRVGTGNSFQCCCMACGTQWMQVVQTPISIREFYLDLDWAQCPKCKSGRIECVL